MDDLHHLQIAEITEYRTVFLTVTETLYILCDNVTELYGYKSTVNAFTKEIDRKSPASEYLKGAMKALNKAV